MKRAYLSILTIMAVIFSTVAITRAYFSETKILGDSENPNIFQTGTVSLQGNTGFPIQLLNMIPGVSEERFVQIQYTGSINSNLYVGAGGTRDTDDPAYLADKLYVIIEEYNGDSLVKEWWRGYAKVLSTEWKNIALDVSKDTFIKYKITFKLDSDLGNEYQNQTNDDTVFLIHAVQKDGPAPTSEPFQDYLDSLTLQG